MKEKIIELIKKGIETFNVDIAIEVNQPKDKKNGDYSSNIALKLAPLLKENPLKLAQKITEAISDYELEKIEVGNPGFINFYLKKDFLLENINKVISLEQDYGRNELGKGKKVNIEFVSANPTGFLHLGNARGGAYGDSLARILKFSGYEVTKEFYINDAGSQIDNLGLSIKSRYYELCKKAFPMPENGYFGSEIKAIAEELYAEKEASYLEEDLEVFKKLGVKKLLAKLIADLEEYGITYDKFTSEKSIYSQYSLKEIIDTMTKRGYAYEKDGALWFKSSSFYDDKDHVLIRSDGSYTYLVPDIAYHIDKYERGYDCLIDVLGTDHHGYVARLKGSIKANGYDDNLLKIKLLQLVRLTKGQEIIKMSKRTGKTVTLKDLIAEVGVNATRYFFALRSLDTQMDFDLELAKKKSNENPVYYVSYAYARICTILKQYDKIPKVTNYKHLSNEETRGLLNYVYNFPEVVKTAALKELPHLICNYAYELANVFHIYYSHNRIITENEKTTNENLNLIKSVQITLKNALYLVGVNPPEKM